MHRGDISILPLTLTFKDGVFDNGCVYCMLPLYVQAQPVISMSLFPFRRFRMVQKHIFSTPVDANGYPSPQVFPEVVNNTVVFR